MVLSFGGQRYENFKTESIEIKDFLFRTWIFGCCEAGREGVISLNLDRINELNLSYRG